jgi:hypothetical protein
MIYVKCLFQPFTFESIANSYNGCPFGIITMGLYSERGQGAPSYSAFFLASVLSFLNPTKV